VKFLLPAPFGAPICVVGVGVAGQIVARALATRPPEGVSVVIIGAHENASGAIAAADLVIVVADSRDAVAAVPVAWAARELSAVTVALVGPSINADASALAEVADIALATADAVAIVEDLAAMVTLRGADNLDLGAVWAMVHAAIAMGEDSRLAVGG
jgi:D-arabinose 5-phosphate isomerase GutQ